MAPYTHEWYDDCRAPEVRYVLTPKGEFVAWTAAKGPYKSDILNTRLAAAKRWLKERQSERTK